ncbi:MAG: hypothetical protein AAF581_07750 [Planctomycetota bacterium]
MPRYRKRDRVRAATEIIFSDRTFLRGHNGHVTHNQGAGVDTVRVKFRGDTGRNYRVVEEDEIEPR